MECMLEEARDRFDLSEPGNRSVWNFGDGTRRSRRVFSVCCRMSWLSERSRRIRSLLLAASKCAEGWSTLGVELDRLPNL